MECLSPDGWEDSSKATHIFFFIDNVETSEDLKPFYNEFIRGDLKEYRKAIEMLSNKVPVEVEDNSNQPLNGFGFMLSEKGSFYIEVNKKVIKVNI